MKQERQSQKWIVIVPDAESGLRRMIVLSSTRKAKKCIARSVAQT
jgi:hypothetical protein